MATESQMQANRANSQLSSGPVTAAGKAIVSQNNFRHGFTGAFKVLPSEDQSAFDMLHSNLREQHEPSTAFESTLVEKMAQHFWLAQRALLLQETCFDPETAEVRDQKQLALFLRYQTTHDRAYHKCSDELRKLRNEKRKEEIGFESQKRREAQDASRAATEKRKEELHQFAVLLAEAKFTHQSGRILDQKIARTMAGLSDADVERIAKAA